MKIKIYITVAIIGLLAVFSCGFLLRPSKPIGAVINYLDTFSSGVTNSTTSIGVAKTQVFNSISKIAGFSNPTGNTISCFLDNTGTLAASSSVASGSGVQIGSGVSSTSTISPQISFGECYPGSVNCYPFKGTVNCVASATSTVATWSK